MTWWERDPGRLERELAALRDAGYDPQPVEVAGRMRVRVKVDVNESQHEMEIRYPDLFPHFRFNIRAPIGLFARHQQPFTGDLCILGPDSDAWDEDDTAAGILATQLLQIAAINGANPGTAKETDQIEAISTYFNYTARGAGEAFVLPPEAYEVDRRQRHGTMTLRVTGEPGVPRGYVTHVGATRGSLPDLSIALGVGREREIAWTRVAELPDMSANVTVIEEELVKTGAIPRATKDERPFAIYGIAFDEEVLYGQPAGTGWAFICRRRISSSQYQSKLVRAERFSREGQEARLRDVAGLEKKRIVVFGVGALGAPISHLLLQARIGHLRIVDHDILSFGNAVRWPLGFQYVGLHKCAALFQFAKANYPETTVEPINWRIGTHHDDGEPSEEDLLDEVFRDVDVAIDATADLAVQHVLALEARARGTPLISVEAREGAYGGRVTLFRPDGACRTCLKYHQLDGRFRLPADEKDTPRPAGCVTPLFTGGSFDLVPLSAYAVRLAAQTLVQSERYPNTPWDVASLFNRKSDEGDIDRNPEWRFERLEIHRSCRAH